MRLDKNSFLQGLAIGRALKGVHIIGGESSAGFVRVTQATLGKVAEHLIGPVVVPPDLSDTASYEASGQISAGSVSTVTISVTVPPSFGTSGYAVIAAITAS